MLGLRKLETSSSEKKKRKMSFTIFTRKFKTLINKRNIFLIQCAYTKIITY